MNEPRVKVVQETNIGLYVWEMPDGRWVGDDQGNWMNIKAKKGDLKRIAQLQDAARSYGIEEGRPVFLPGLKRINDEQYEEQVQRLRWGLTPDPDDEFAAIDEIRWGKS